MIVYKLFINKSKLILNCTDTKPSQMATIKMKLRTDYRRKDGTHQIVIEIRTGNERKVIDTGFCATPDQWDQSSQNIHPKRHPAGPHGAYQLAAKLAEWQKTVWSASMEHDDGPQLLGAVTKNHDTRMTLVEWIQRIEKRHRRSGHTGNAKVFGILAAQLEKFEPDIQLKNVDHRFIERFKLHKYANGVGVNTIHNYLRTLRAAINEAIRAGILDANAYPFKRGVMPRLKPTAKRAVTVDDLQKVWEYHPTSERLSRAKELTMAMFYLRGMDLVDVLHLTSDNIRNGRIETTRQKTGQPVSVLIVDPMWDIIRRQPDGVFLFSVLTKTINQDRANYETHRSRIIRSMVRMGREIGIEQRLTSKVIRHTFATVAKHLGCPIEIVGEMLGHQTSSVTAIYQSPFTVAMLDDWHLKVSNQVHGKGK